MLVRSFSCDFVSLDDEIHARTTTELWPEKNKRQNSSSGSCFVKATVALTEGCWLAQVRLSLLLLLNTPRINLMDTN